PAERIDHLTKAIVDLPGIAPGSLATAARPDFVPKGTPDLIAFPSALDSARQRAVDLEPERVVLHPGFPRRQPGRLPGGGLHAGGAARCVPLDPLVHRLRRAHPHAPPERV